MQTVSPNSSALPASLQPSKPSVPLSEAERQKRAKARKQNRANAVQNFEHLPDSAGVRADVVARIFDCGIATVWRRARTGRLPKPYRPSAQATLFNVGELRKKLRELHGSGETTEAA